MNAVQETLKSASDKDGIGLICFLTAGDPDIESSKKLLKALDQNQVSTIELCVPFPDSFTDGKVIKKSHARALANEVVLRDVLELVQWSRTNISAEIVLLADFSHSIRPIGMDVFINRCSDAGVTSLLLHGLPPRMKDSYEELCEFASIFPVTSFYSNSKQETRQASLAKESAFVYVVSSFGRSGGSLEFDEAFTTNLAEIRESTDRALALGFGVSTGEHLNSIRQVGFEAAIIGSKVMSLVERAIEESVAVDKYVKEYLEELWCEYNYCREA